MPVAQGVEDLYLRFVGTLRRSRVHRRVGIGIPRIRIPPLDYRGPTVEIAPEADFRRGSGLHFRPYGYADIAQTGAFIELRGIVGVGDHLVPLDPVPRSRLHNLVLGVEGEIAAPCEEPVVPVHDDIIPFALDGDIRIAAYVVDIPLRVDRLDCGDADAKPHLQGVDSSSSFHGRHGAAVRLVEKILEGDVGFLESHGVDVGDVIADDVEKRLVSSRARHARHKRSKHVHSSLLYVRRRRSPLLRSLQGRPSVGPLFRYFRECENVL